MEFRYRPPMPGTAKIFSMTREPDMIPMKLEKMAGRMTTMQFFIAWRTVAWPRVRPLVRASSMNSLVSTSVSSARVVRVKPAMVPKLRLSTGGSWEMNTAQVR